MRFTMCMRLIMSAVLGLLVATPSLTRGQGTAPPSARDKFSPSDEQEFDGLIIRCPVRLVHTSETLTQNPGIKHQETYQADENGLLAGVVSIDAVEGVELSLEGAAAGAIKKISQTPGVTSLKHTTEDVTVSGIPAKRTLYSSLAGGKDLYGGGLCLMKGQHIWIITLVSRDAAKVPVMKAILDSARFHDQEKASPLTRDKSSPSDEQELSGLIIRCPAPLIQLTSRPSDNPDMKDVAQYKADGDGFVVALVSFESTQSVEPNLARTATGAIEKMSRTPGFTSPKSTTNDVTVSGVPAKRISLTAMADGKETHAEMLCVIKKQRLWALSILFQDAAKAPVAKAILDSARIK